MPSAAPSKGTGEGSPWTFIFAAKLVAVRTQCAIAFSATSA